MSSFVINTLAAYAITFVITSSSILAQPRAWLMAHTAWLCPTGHRHFLECRMCVGFWSSLLVCGFTADWRLLLAVYGASYFLATQER